MVQIKGSHTKNTPFKKQINPIESLNNGRNIGIQNPIDQMFGNFYEPGTAEQDFFNQEKDKPTAGQRREFSIFSYQNYYETEVVKKQIKELTEQVKKEITYLKKADTALAADLKDIEKLAIDSLPEKPGVYHVRFLEIILRILKSLREKVGESRTWLSAMVSRKKKRGSLFAVLSKKKGTQYSLSQELTNARSIQ